MNDMTHDMRKTEADLRADDTQQAMTMADVLTSTELKFGEETGDSYFSFF